LAVALRLSRTEFQLPAFDIYCNDEGGERKKTEKNLSFKYTVGQKRGLGDSIRTVNKKATSPFKSQ